MDKQREEIRRQFEEWARAEGFSLERGIPEGDVSCIYTDGDTYILWLAWQASRASIVVNIDWPEANDDHWKSGEEGAYAQGYEIGKDLTAIKVRNALRSIGLSIKGE